MTGGPGRPAFCGTDRLVNHFHTLTGMPPADFDLEKAIGLLWAALRDVLILGNRLELAPVTADGPVVKPTGLAALERAGRIEPG